jgi:hypothetical protein
VNGGKELPVFKKLAVLKHRQALKDVKSGITKVLNTFVIFIFF